MSDFLFLYEQVEFFEALRQAMPEVSDDEARTLWKLSSTGAMA